LRFQKAVITAAGPNQRALPLQTLIDRDGHEKSVLGILIEQGLAAKVEEICVVVWPGARIRRNADWRRLDWERDKGAPKRINDLV
jgi:UTP--glucose-1-phosphate uridylyltransferase